MPNYPTSLDTLTNPTSGNTLDSPPHATQHTDANDIVEALESKVGTGASTPTTPGHVLTVTAVGTTAYQAQPVLSSTVTLTDAQIKALPTTAVQIVAAPGAAKVIYVLGTVCRLQWVANYTNIAAGADVSIMNGLNALGGKLLEADFNVSGLLAFGEAAWAFIPPYSTAAGSIVTGTAGWADAELINQPATVKMYNVAAGNLTGGNAGNSLKVTVIYTVIDAA